MEAPPPTRFQPKFAYNFIFPEDYKEQIAGVVAGIFGFAVQNDEEDRLAINQAVNRLLQTYATQSEEMLTNLYSKLLKCVVEVVVNKNQKNYPTIMPLLKVLVEELPYYDPEVLSLVYLVADSILYRDKLAEYWENLAEIIEFLGPQLSFGGSAYTFDSIKGSLKTVAFVIKAMRNPSADRPDFYLERDAGLVIQGIHSAQSQQMTGFWSAFASYIRLLNGFVEASVGFNSQKIAEYPDLPLLSLSATPKNPEDGTERVWPEGAGEFATPASIKSVRKVLRALKKFKRSLISPKLDKKSISSVQKSVMDLRKRGLILLFAGGQREEFVGRAVDFLAVAVQQSLLTGKPSHSWDSEILKLFIRILLEAKNGLLASILSQFLVQKDSEVDYSSFRKHTVSADLRQVQFIHDLDLLTEVWRLNAAALKDARLDEALKQRVQSPDIAKANIVSGKTTVQLAQFSSLCCHLKLLSLSETLY